MKMIMTNYWQKRIFCLITSIFILTGYKIFCEEFIIPIKYDYNGKLLSNATHYIHSFTVGDTVFTQYKMKVYQSHEFFNILLYNGYDKPYRDGTNLVINISAGVKLHDLFYLSSIGIFVETPIILNRYSFYENYINNPSFRMEIKRLADFLDRSGVVYSVNDLSKTFNSALSNNITMINYLQKIQTYLEKSYFMQTISNLDILDGADFNTKTKFKIQKKKFKYDFGGYCNSSTGGVLLSEYKLEQFQMFLDKKKINLKLSEYIKAEADDIEKVIISLGYIDADLNSELEYKDIIGEFERLDELRKKGFREYKYYILDLKDFIIGKVETPYWLY